MGNNTWPTVGIVAGGVLATVLTIYVAKRLLSGGKKKRADKLLKELTVKYPVKLVDKEELSHDTRRFRFKLHAQDQILGMPIGQHLYLSTRIDGELVVRPYTPVTLCDQTGYFDLVVKVYFKDVNPKFPAGGKLSQYLNNLSVGDTIDVRGPGGLLSYEGRGHYAIKEAKNSPSERFFYKRIGMIAGGTGITPMLQLVREIFRDDQDRTSISLIFANQTPADILLEGELRDLQLEYPNRFNLWFTVDRDAPADWKYSTGFIDEQMIKEHLPAPADDTLIVMCGPPPMIKFACMPNLEKVGHKKTFAY